MAAPNGSLSYLPVRIDSTPRRISASAAASLALHALALVLWGALSGPTARAPETAEGPTGDEDDDVIFVDIDIEAPPEAPKAHAPVEPEPEPEPEPIPEPEIEDEAVVVPDPAAADAGPPSADALLTEDAGPAIDAGPPADAAESPALARDAETGPPGDAAAHVARSPRDAASDELGELFGEGAGERGPIPAGAAADLRRYAPEGDVITVLLRLDRIRDTPWEERVRGIVEPMPDYRAIIGGRDLELADHLDLLVISSFEPQSVTATTLAARSRERAAALRELLDHDGAPIAWRDVALGKLGERLPGPAHHRADPRVYVLPAELEHWLVLARPEHIGALDKSEPPNWVRALPDVAAEAGEKPDGPIAVVSASGLPDSLQIPRVGVFPAPSHVAMAVEIDPQGFRIRGTMTFASEERAEAFEERAREAVDRVTGSATWRIILRRMHAYNALRGLSLQRAGERVGYATSVSIADAQTALDFAADWTARYFGVAAPDDEAEGDVLRLP